MVKYFPGVSLFLKAYTLAWKSVLPFLVAFVKLDALCNRVLRCGFLPGHWHMQERLMPVGPTANPIHQSAFEIANEMVFETASENRSQNSLWLHCASLGEAKGLWALVCNLLQEGAIQGGNSVLSGTTTFRLLLTANTTTGRDFLEQASADFNALNSQMIPKIFVAIAPLDHPSVLRAFFQIWHVQVVILYEAEVWPNCVLMSATLGIPVLLVSARMSQSAYSLYRRFPNTCARILGSLNWIQTQSEKDRVLFQSLSGINVAIGYDFKAAFYLKANLPVPKDDFLISKSSTGRCRLAFVSIHYAELRLLAAQFSFLFAANDVIIIPRHLKELPRIRRLLDPFWKPMEFGLYSSSPQARNLLVDSLGHVASLLPRCQMAFVGGSLISIGCHNLWEPLMAGLKIYFGPNYGPQASLAERLLDLGIAEMVSDVAQVRNWSKPGPEMAVAIREFIIEGQADLEHAQVECRERIFATLNTLSGDAAKVTLSRRNER